MNRFVNGLHRLKYTKLEYAPKNFVPKTEPHMIEDSSHNSDHCNNQQNGTDLAAIEEYSLDGSHEHTVNSREPSEFESIKVKSRQEAHYGISQRPPKTTLNWYWKSYLPNHLQASNMTSYFFLATTPSIAFTSAANSNIIVAPKGSGNKGKYQSKR